MTHRSNPIKFGPEWLRNMPSERSATRGNNNQTNSPGQGTAASTGSPGATGGAAVTTGSTTTITNTTGTSRVLLAKLRYGREEMLALYDKNAEAPAELKVIDTLYQPRGKQPVALNSTFEDDMRENVRGAPPIGGLSPGERFVSNRSAGRGVVSDGRGRPRTSYIRPQPPVRGAHYMPKVGGPRMPYAGAVDDESPIRSWGNNTVNNNARNTGEQTDWAYKMSRNKRLGTNTNWRQPQTRDDGEEWRNSDPVRSRQLEKWEREWGDRASGEKPQSWSSNRRTWVGGDTQNDDNLPEWVGENAECGGTFDSSGAFHGYSNDDTNLPKHQDSSYSLTRSHTHGCFPRPKILEEGSDEWWASEKAKKLSPKRFDASEIKFKKQSSMPEGGHSSTNEKSNINKEDLLQEAHDKRELAAAGLEPPEANAAAQMEEKYSNQNLFKSKYTESKTFDALMRSDINVEEASDERGNFQSVIIASNNSLRQKHQHMVMAVDGQKHMRMGMKGNNKPEPDNIMQDMLVENMFGMTIDDEEILSTTLSKSGISSELSAGASLQQNQNQNIQMSMSNSTISNLSGRTMDMHLNKQSMQPSGLQSGHPMSNMQPNMLSSPGMQKVAGMQMPPGGHMQNPGMQKSSMSNSVMTGMQNPGLPQSGIQTSQHPSSAMQPNLQSSGMQSGLQSSGMQSGHQSSCMQSSLQSSDMQSGLQSNVLRSGLQSSGMQAPGVQTPVLPAVMQNVGITNQALNASLGLPVVPSGVRIGIPMQGVPQQVMVCVPNNMPSSNMGVMGSSSMQATGNMSNYQSASGLQGMSGNNAGNNSLFLGQNSNNPSMSSGNEMPMSNNVGQMNMFPLHGMQHSGSQGSFGNSMYSNNQNLTEQWYYEDPERNIQGPFSSKDMYNWYRAGFFSPSLMVRRACETMMRPLGSYGPVVPFIQLDVIPGFPMSGAYESHPQGGHESILNSQPSLGLDVMNIGNMNMSDNTPIDSLQFGSVGLISNQSFGQPQQMVDALWGQSSTSADIMWMQQSLPRSEARVNNLPVYFWDQQPSAIASNSLLPEDITKEMKTEDQILAQLRDSQNMNQSGLLHINDPQPPPPPPAAKPEDCFPPMQAATTPNLEELHKLIQKDTLTGSSINNELANDTQTKVDKIPKLDQSSSDSSVSKQSQNKSTVESKTTKQAKDTDKSAKNKENNNTKNKSKKSKEEKKDDEIKPKEEDIIKSEKWSQESSPTKNKKEEKTNKKELEREKKEWIKEGFTLVKGSEKSSSKDNKKKTEETRAAEEAERKRKEEEKLAVEEDKKKKQAESVKKLQEQQQLQQQRQVSESVLKKAPWSAVATQSLQATDRDGLTLAEIQRLEREKKLEQMKEQQQMMQIIAQQQAAALAREQEMQAGLGWAKKKSNNASSPGQSLAEIQAEARKQAAAAAAAAAAQALEEAQAAAVVTPPTVNNMPWGNALNGGGFWDTQLEQSQKQTKQEPPKVDQNKVKKKPTVIIPPKKEMSPAIEFDNWCNGTLSSWSSKIDVPTFVNFLKDIESPYEVKDYVKCYLGESKDSSDFSRQFLERRSKLLRVGMVTPSDDLCSPAIAVNPRTISGSDYQEVKGKGKKTKKNKMLKVDARILGFSVTAAEDRINVGDIDTV